MKVATRYFRQRIENHFDDHDLDVAVHKRKQGYAVYWADDGLPLAQLRPTGDEDEVAIYSWHDDHWEPVTEFGPSMALDVALSFITDDPLDLFFEPAGDDDEQEELESPLDAELKEQLGYVGAELRLMSPIGAAAGGLCGSALSGLKVGFLTALICTLVVSLIVNRLRITWQDLLLSILCGLAACVGSVTGGALHGALGSGWGPSLAGLVVGVGCNLLWFRGGVLAWLVGLVAGLNVAMGLIDAWQLREHFGGFVLVAVLSAGAASLCRRLSNVSVAIRRMCW